MAMSDTPSAKPNKRGLRLLWDRLTKPSVIVEEVGLRRQVRFLSALTLALFLILVATTIATMFNGTEFEVTVALVATTAFLAVAYIFSRSRWYTVGAYLVVGSLTLIAYGRIWFGEENIALNLFAFIPLAFLFGSILLPIRTSAVVVGVNFVAILTLPLWVTNFTYVDIGVSLGPIYTLGILFLLAQNYRDNVERDRLGELTETNEALEALRVGLDERVKLRTHELEEANEQVQTILESVVTPVIIARLSDATIAYVNQPAAEALQEARDALPGRTTLEFYHDPAEAVPFIEELQAEGFVTSYDLRLKRNDGSSLWTLASSRLMNYEGEPAIITTLVDITERSQTEQAIRERETLLRTIIDSTPDWIFVKDVDHRYLMVNQGYADSFHMTPADFIGKNDLEIGFPEEIVMGNPEKGIRGFWADDREIMERGEMKIIDEEPAVVDGEDRFLNTIKAPLKDGHGHVTGIVGFVHDITDRKQIEAELEEAQKRTEEILESITVPLVIARVSDGKALYLNEPLAEIVRLPREGLLGQTTPDFYHNPADRLAYLTALQEKGQVTNFELRLKRGDGDLFWSLVSGRVINFQGEPAVITSLIDITSRREAQATVTRRARELETVAEVGTVAATILEPDTLLQQVVDLTKERFGLYHTHIYLLDEDKTALVLANGAGEVGRTMVAEGRQIALDQEQSLVARAARTREGVVINDVQADPGFLPHPLLPETRAEMAVPLIAGDEVQGVLDVQADAVNRFTAEDINIFTTLAAQIAVALQNARRYAQSQEALDELTRLQRVMAREGWQAFLTAQERPFVGYAFDGKGAKQIIDKYQAEKLAASDGEAEETPAETAVSIPIAVRGETIGQFGLRNPDGSAIPERKRALLQNIANQVSEALERARLSEQTQQALTQTNEQARRLAKLNDLSEEISRAETLNEMVSLVMQQVPEILKASRFSLHLIDEEDETMLRVVGVAGESGDTGVGELIPLEESPMAQALEKRQIVAGSFKAGEETLQAYFAPLYASGQPLGTFNMALPADDVLSEGGRQILLQIASLLGTTLENRRLFDQTRARADREQLLNNITRRIQGTVTMEAALQTAVQELGEALKLKKAVVELATKTKENGRQQAALEKNGESATEKSAVSDV